MSASSSSRCTANRRQVSPLQPVANMVLYSKPSGCHWRLSPSNSRLDGVFEQERKDKLWVTALNLVTRGHSQVAFEQSCDWQQMVLDSAPGRCSSPRGRPGTLWTWNACQDCVIIFREEGKDTQSEPLHLPSIGIAQRREVEVSWPTGPREKLRRLRENRDFQ